MFVAKGPIEETLLVERCLPRDLPAGEATIGEGSAIMAGDIITNENVENMSEW